MTAGDSFCCDYSNAARTQLLNLKTGEWDEEMLALFHIPRAALPEIKPSSGLFGYTRGLKTIPDGIPVMAMVGDSHAALLVMRWEKRMCESDLWDRFFHHGPVNSAQCDIATLATTIARHDGENIIYGLEGNIPHRRCRGMDG
nr:FGGY family carbohydrate kinase [Escherichia fergusonii]